MLNLYYYYVNLRARGSAVLHWIGVRKHRVHSHHQINTKLIKNYQFRNYLLGKN